MAYHIYRDCERVQTLFVAPENPKYPDLMPQEVLLAVAHHALAEGGYRLAHEETPLQDHPARKGL